MNFKLDNDNNALIENIEVTAEKNTATTLIIKYETENDECYYHNGIIRTKTYENAKLNIIVLNMINETSNNFLSIENDLENNSEVHFYIVDMGGKNSITNYYSNIKGECANNQLNTIYLGKNDQTYDLNYIAELRGEKSNIDIEVEGALKNPTIIHNVICYPKLWFVHTRKQSGLSACNKGINCSCKKYFNLWHYFANQTDYYNEIARFTGVKSN